MLILAALLLASIPEGWLPPEITPGHAPARIVITKTGWRSGTAGLIVDDRRQVDPVWRELSRLFAQARHQPSHYVVALRQPVPMSTAPLRAKTKAFGSIVEGDPLLLASRRRWTKARLEKLRRATVGLAKVEVIPEVHLGN